MNDNYKNIFEDRADALDSLISILPIEKMKLESWHILSISVGGVYLAKSISDTLNAEFDFLFTDTIYAPNNKECEIAIVTETNDLVMHEELVNAFGVDFNYIFGEAQRGHDRLLENIYKYRKESIIKGLSGKQVLLVDDGVESGLTIMSAIKSVLNLGAKSVSIALPVMPKSVVNDIQDIADDLYCVYKIDHFIDVNFYYKSLNKLTLKDINHLLSSNK